MANRAQPLVAVCLDYGLTGSLPLNEESRAAVKEDVTTQAVISKMRQRLSA